MGQVTGIPWCHHTFNGWIGCAKVSSGCENCYAEAEQDHRYHRVRWGKLGTRHITTDANWRQPYKWDREAKAACERRRVFAFSLADWLEIRPDLDLPRARLLATISATRNLDWLLLTKRPEDWRTALVRASGAAASGPYPGHPIGVMVSDWLDGAPPPNVWMGASGENRHWAIERSDRLRNIPAAVRFLSAEPLLYDLNGGPPYLPLDLSGIDWLILGGESGEDAKIRACDLRWIRNGIAECRRQGVACYVKQLGSWIETSHHESLDALDEFPGEPRLSPGKLWDGNARVHLVHPKGGDPAEWPEDIRIREFPSVTSLARAQNARRN